ncbi:MAG: nucleoside triphosphate pyrophosphohydrolase [Desulfobacterales bacterium]|nr:nucleoside triphosphate pyrophosphohydrolase [Desulfobacterales bacterium]
MESIAPILEIIRTLRGEGGCAWDRKQTPLSMWKCLAEEMYELEDALVKEDRENTCEEMGDVLFQILFIMEIFNERRDIPFGDVVKMVSEKMIRRHPHVYESAQVENETELLAQWDKIKAEEKAAAKSGDGELPSVSALDNVPQGMPGLMRALKVSKAAVKVGFEWENIHQVLDTVKSEIMEFEEALEKGNKDEMALEFGDILFSLVNVARFAGFHPETALAQSTAKFEGRFRRMEELLEQDGQSLDKMPPPEKEAFWRRAKLDYDK